MDNLDRLQIQRHEDSDYFGFKKEDAIIMDKEL